MIPARLLVPQLATLSKEVPSGDAWLHEIKYDGYRIVAAKDGDAVRLLSRTGKDYSAVYPSVRDAVKKLKAKRLVLDGEVAVVDGEGKTHFQSLQNGGDVAALRYFVFDLLLVDEEVLEALPLEQRKQRLHKLAMKDPLRYSDHVIGDGEAFFALARERGLEGIVSKRRSAPYVHKRSTDWLKVKSTARQEVVVGGYTIGEGRFAGSLGALHCGVYAKGKLVYAGKVGTGFDRTTAEQLLARLRELEQKDSPFASHPLPPAEVRKAHWVKPELVAEVEFTEWTGDGRMRHPSYQGLREDKPAKKVVREG